jgi:hypothetical protein
MGEGNVAFRGACFEMDGHSSISRNTRDLASCKTTIRQQLEDRCQSYFPPQNRNSLKPIFTMSKDNFARS